jgi:predicted nucleotidyltransferase component of viral defense system
MTVDEIVREARAQNVLWSLAVKAEVMRLFLAALSRSPFAGDLVLQGGGAMKFVYGSPRYSVDLDFVLSSPTDLSRFSRLGDILPDALNHPLKAAARRLSDKMFRVSLVLKLDQRELLSTKVEICSVVSETAHIEKSESGNTLTESPQEILVDKLTANLDRLQRKGFVKTHDIFDLYYLMNRFPGLSVKKEDLLRKLAAYGTTLEESTSPALLAWFDREQHFDEFCKALEGCVSQVDLQRISLKKAYESVKALLRNVLE